MVRRPCQPDEWPTQDHKQTRVLVEHADPALLWAHQRVLEAAGYEFAGCSGPDGPRRPCPLTEAGTCPVAEAADVVIHGLSLSESTPSDVLDALRSTLPGTPVVVQVARPVTPRRTPLPRGSMVISSLPITRESVLGAVRRALGARPTRIAFFPADHLRDEPPGSF